MGGQPPGSRDEELLLVDHLITMPNWGSPYSQLDFRLTVKAPGQV